MNKPLSLLLFVSLLTGLASSPLHADETATLKVQVVALQQEVQTLRAENERLQMLKVTEVDRLSLLMTYTTFHIGVYISLGAAIIAAQAIGNLSHWSLRFVALPCLILAGIAGGVIACGLAEYSLFPQTTTFANKRLGFWGFRPCTYWVWARMEHAAFWIGVLMPTGRFLFKGAAAFSPQRKAKSELPKSDDERKKETNTCPKREVDSKPSQSDIPQS